MGQIIPIILRNLEGLIFLSRSSAGPALIDIPIRGHKVLQVPLVPDIEIVKAGV